MQKSNERAVAGITTGLINTGESVTWEATHFGIRQKLTSKITYCEPPRYFQDVMVSGAFASFSHDHYFEEMPGGTLMKDVFNYRSPLGFLGNLADKLFLESYMRRILTERNELIKQIAESEDWRKYL
jgi:ligand-binding SRPBCC domain-containing protein